MDADERQAVAAQPSAAGQADAAITGAVAFSLERYERHVWRRDHEAACRELLLLLAALDRGHGSLPAPQPPLDALRCTRIAAATAGLLVDPGLQFAAPWVATVLALQRWLSAIFEVGTWGSGDAVIEALNTAAAPSTLAIAPRDIVKFALLYGPASALPLDIGALWRHDRRLAAGLAVALLSPRLAAGAAAHAKRELLLPWLALHLEQIDDIDELPGAVLHDVFMQCSYALRADKHDVKRAISRLVQRSLARRGFAPLPPPAPPAPGAKPVLLVLVEWFTAGHSMLRTHSRSIDGARAAFHVVGAGYDFAVDDAGRAVFDRFEAIVHGSDIDTQLRQLQDIARRSAAAVLYMPSVGMSQLTLFAANLRLAPLQVMGLGHPATAHAGAIDCALVEDDYVGDPRCFSEPLLRLPADAMPYRPPDTAAPAPAAPRPRVPRRVEIALCATLMKLNPVLLAACAAVVRQAPLPVHFRLLVGQAQGIVVPQVQHAIDQAFPAGSATLHRQQPYADYRAVIAGCDLFVNPFPFGNTNGTIDCVGAGLVGVCKTGPEVHEHIDEGMFRRLGFPGWLVAATVRDYIDAAIRLAASHDERADLCARHAGPDKVALFYAGRPQVIGEMLLQRLASTAGSATAA